MALSVFLAQATTGRVFAELDGVRGTFSADIAGQNVRASLQVPVRAAVDLRAALEPWRTTVVVGDENLVWWAGPITAPVTRERGGDVSVSAGSVWALLDRVPGWLPGPRPPSVQADLVVTGRSTTGLVATRLDNAIRFSPLPLRPPVGVLEGPHGRRWASAALSTSATLLRELVDVDYGRSVETIFEPRWAGGSSNAVEWTTRVGAPLGGGTHLWDAGSDAVVALVDQGGWSEPVSTAWVGGAGQEQARVIGAAQDGMLPSGGWPALHRIETSGASSIADVRAADAYAASLLRGRQRAALVPVVAGDGAPGRDGVAVGPAFHEWALGDAALVDVVDDEWVPDGRYEGRIEGWSCSLGSGEVALSMATPDREVTQPLLRLEEGPGAT